VSLKDTRYLLDLLKAEGIKRDRLRVVLNHVRSGGPGSAEEAEKVLQTGIDVQIPHDGEVARSCVMGTPVTLARPRSPAAKQFARLADQITGQPGIARVTRYRTRGMQRFIRRLRRGGRSEAA
ncbi:MAG: hypothetical protein V3V06_02275, partial [Dehalococcoidia bacterium]